MAQPAPRDHSRDALTITAGVPLTVVSKTLRHSTLSTTANIYSHLTQQAAREAVDTIQHTLTRAEQKNHRQARLKALRSLRDHVRRLREALNRPATTLRPPSPQTRQRPPSHR
ncbi:hypothetical protein [Streptomyces sp. 3213.3]|uniref:hypothetical protein n=1 Tax=Streptomyces sp. 3213.3 TaxID=1855348 RepID=UPI00135C853E|nr:hypothetical protein [Streptomyces sp. 3213.3]